MHSHLQQGVAREGGIGYNSSKQLLPTELLYRNFIVGGMFGPLTEVWSTKLVAQIREGGIRTEPMGILV